MRVCIPTVDANGMEAKASGHFGSAPYFTLVDLDTQKVESVQNEHAHHEHGSCNPVASLMGKEVDAVVCHGLSGGQGAAGFRRT